MQRGCNAGATQQVQDEKQLKSSGHDSRRARAKTARLHHPCNPLVYQLTDLPVRIIKQDYPAVLQPAADANPTRIDSLQDGEAEIDIGAIEYQL